MCVYIYMLLLLIIIIVIIIIIAIVIIMIVAIVFIDLSEDRLQGAQLAPEVLEHGAEQHVRLCVNVMYNIHISLYIYIERER